MADTLPVSIGDMQLTGAEVPAFFDRGGELRTVSVQTITGDRIIQVIGTTPSRRQLSGVFLGPDAVDRAQSLENLRDSAVPVLMSIGIWTEYVLITNVILRYAEKGSVIHYVLEAETLAPPLQQIVETAAMTVGSIVADLVQGSSILSSGVSTGSEAILPDLSQAQTAVTTSFAAGGPVNADLTTPSTEVMSLIATQGSLISSVSQQAPVTSIVADAGDLFQAVQSSAALAAAVQAAGYVNRAGANMASLNGGTFSPTIHS